MSPRRVHLMGAHVQDRAHPRHVRISHAHAFLKYAPPKCILQTMKTEAVQFKKIGMRLNYSRVRPIRHHANQHALHLSCKVNPLCAHMVVRGSASRVPRSWPCSCRGLHLARAWTVSPVCRGQALHVREGQPHRGRTNSIRIGTSPASGSQLCVCLREIVCVGASPGRFQASVWC